MRDPRVRAYEYRERATEMRALAEADKTRENHDALMKIAVDYDRLATSLDAIADSKDILSGD